ncbi:MAG: TIM barrel protein [Verrucomicrobiales bacterium]|nr:TIM barrel protein [Verrucomicrobiales bacterium]
MNRRDCLKSIAAAGTASSIPQILQAAEGEKFKIDYVLATALYGDMKLSEILPEVEHTGSIGIDIWGKPHGTQREEIDQMGIEAFGEMLAETGTKVVASTRYPLGCFGLQPEMPILKQLGGKILVAGSPKTRELKNAELKSAVSEFIEAMKPHADAAAEHGLTIAIENHSDQLISGPDAIRYFGEFNRHPAMGLAFAPHHLKDHMGKIPELILELGKANLPFIYFQEYGDGAFHKLQKQVELEQMPGRGTLDYVILMRALKYIDFDGVGEIFMHPTPRGIPVLESVDSITELFNESRIYIDQCIKELG